MKKTKLYLLTGFLGSGKTTFLQKVLEELAQKKVAVIMNEFGKVGIDGPIIKKDGMELVEINKGSIFCSCLQLNFISALVEMADREMDYVFVESSGLADPSNIGEFLDAVEVAKGDVYEYCGSICLVDGLNFLEQVDDLETVEKQLRFCHLVLISKVDLVEPEQLKKVEEKVKEINPTVPIVQCEKGHIDYAFLENSLVKEEWSNEDSSNTPDTKPKTLTLTYPDTVTKEKLTAFLDLIKGDSYRIKGFFELEDGWHQVDVVGKRIDYVQVEEKDEESQLVIISRIGNQIIRPIFNAWETVIGDTMKLR